MKAYNLILKRRSIRKFLKKKIDRKILLDCVNAARLSPSAGNLQLLQYIVATKNLDKIFSCVKFAKYIRNWSLNKNERPKAYIVIISRDEKQPYLKYDVGLAAENIVLTALERNVASCILAPNDKERLRKILKIPENYSIELLIALGYARHKSFEEQFKGSVEYWVDKKGNFHVPKKSLTDVLHEEKF